MMQRFFPLILVLPLLAGIGADGAAAQAPVIPAPLIDVSALVETPDVATARHPARDLSWTRHATRTGSGIEPGPTPVALSEEERRRWGITGLMLGGAVGLGAGAFLCGFARAMVGGDDTRQLGCTLAFGAGGAALGGIVGASADLFR